MKTELRFFVDQRAGNVAVRDRQHPQYDPDYPGLHQDTVDVVFYAHGFQSGTGWTVNDFDIIKAHTVCDHLNAQFNKPPVYRQEDLEKVLDWAECGIYHNHGYNEEKLGSYLAIIARFKRSLSVPPGSVDVEEKKEYCDGTFYCSLDSTYNSDGTCGGCGKKKRNGVDGLGDSSGSVENQEQLWKEVFHQSGSRMDFMQFLQKHFTITRKP